MNEKPLKQLEKENERQRILNQATLIISKNGIVEFSMRTLARELDMSATNIYHYFHNRDEILLHIICDIYTAVAKEREQAWNAGSDPLESAKNVLWAVFYFSVKSFPYYDIIYGRRVLPDLDKYRGTELEPLSLKVENIILNKFSLWDEIVRAIVPGKTEDEYRIIELEIGTRLHGAIRYYHNSPYNRLFADKNRMVTYTINQIMLDLQDSSRWENI